jgi:hypothetical protein
MDCTKLGLAREYLLFLKQRKKVWLIPIIVVFLLVGILLAAVQGSIVAPFIYTLF